MALSLLGTSQRWVPASCRVGQWVHCFLQLELVPSRGPSPHNPQKLGV